MYIHISVTYSPTFRHLHNAHFPFATFTLQISTSISTSPLWFLFPTPIPTTPMSLPSLSHQLKRWCTRRTQCIQCTQRNVKPEPSKSCTHSKGTTGYKLLHSGRDGVPLSSPPPSPPSSQTHTQDTSTTATVTAASIKPAQPTKPNSVPNQGGKGEDETTATQAALTTPPSKTQCAMLGTWGKQKACIIRMCYGIGGIDLRFEMGKDWEEKISGCDTRSK